VNDDFSQAADDDGRSEGFGREFDNLFRFVGAVGSNLDIDTLLDDAISQLSAMARADQILIAVILGDEEIAQAVMVKKRGLPELTGAVVSTEDIAGTGTDAISGINNQELPRSLRGVARHLKGPWAVIPFTVYRRHVGFMVVSRRDTFNESTVKLLNLAGRQLAIAVENSRLFRDLQRSYRRLVDTQEELIRSERLAAVGGLAATMAHEIRNPLATIFSSLSQVRKHGQITGDSATLIEIAEEEAARLNRMVGGLLEFARPKMARIDEVNPLEVIEEVVAATLNNPEFPSGVDLAVTPDSERIYANLDPELFRRAIQHVISNAVDAVEPGKGKISIHVEEDKNQGEKLVVAVRDNGSGITPELKPSIFEPFFSTKPAGIGLGLSVVKRIVEDHKGSIEVNTEVGAGTEVRLLFNK
jgi:signal transduction histidine kinase